MTWRHPTGRVDRYLDVETLEATVPEVTWDPRQYLRYADERARPFTELLSRVGAEAPASVVDLGCGPATLTRTLLARWPAAHVLGVDSSPEMVAEARGVAVPGRLDVVLADLRDWRPERPVDVLISNATLQWVPGHLDLLPRLVDMLAPGGWLAVQVPANAGEPSHTTLDRLRAEQRWRDRLGPAALPRPAVAEPGDYLDALARLGLRVDVWETSYLHVLPGDDAVLDWMRGTGLRPVLSALSGDDREAFLTEYAARLRVAYPRRRYGTVLRYRRIFVVARATD